MRAAAYIIVTTKVEGVTSVMKTRLELDALVYKYLDLIASGYETGDFEPLYPYLAKDCVLESMWVITPNVGYDAVVSYLTGKGKTLKRTDSFPSCSIQELVGNINTIKNADINVNGKKQSGSVGLYYPSGELCLLMEQTIEDKTNGVILRVKINDEEKISRIDLCMPELFNYRCFCTYVSLCPCKDDVEIEDGMIRVNEGYYSELYFFLDKVGIRFDEFDDLHIPMEKWIDCLEHWKRFYSFDTFDKAFECACDIDYDNFTIGNLSAMRLLSYNGDNIWNNRNNNTKMLYGLIEWTEKYKNSCDFINTYGF